MSNTTNPLKWVKASERVPEKDNGERVFVRRIESGYKDCLTVSYLKLFPNHYEWLDETTSKESNTDCSRSFLACLEENYQAQIAGYYNYDKTDEERKIRNAVIEEYKDLIAIYKSKYLSANTDCSVEQAAKDFSESYHFGIYSKEKDEAHIRGFIAGAKWSSQLKSVDCSVEKNVNEIDGDLRMIIGHAFLGEEQNISRGSFDLVIGEIIKYFNAIKSSGIIDLIRFVKDLEYMDGSKPQSQFTPNEILSSYNQGSSQLKPVDCSVEQEAFISRQNEIIGRLTTEVSFLKDSQSKRDEWLREAKQAAGYDNYTSFDVVWKDALAALKSSQLKPVDCSVDGFLKELREKSVKRAVEKFNCYDNQPLTFWTTALAGELGELCNMIKKLKRAEAGGIDIGSTYTAKDITTEMLKEEIGGIAIYLDLLASLLGIDTQDAITFEFNRVSKKYDLGYFLTPPNTEQLKQNEPGDEKM